MTKCITWIEGQRFIDRCVPPARPGRGGASIVQKSVLHAIHSFAGNGECYPSHATIAARACVSAETARMAIKALEGWGAIRRTPRFDAIGGRSTDRYHFDYRIISELGGMAGKGECADDEAPSLPPPTPHPVGGPTPHPVGGPTPHPVGGKYQDEYQKEEKARDAKPSRPARTEKPVQGQLLPDPAPSPNAPVGPHDAKIAFVAAYVRRYGVEPTWAGREAKDAKAVLGRLSRAADAFRPPRNTRALLHEVIDRFIADNDQFLVKRAHAFAALPERLGAYVRNIGGPALATATKKGAWN